MSYRALVPMLVLAASCTKVPDYTVKPQVSENKPAHSITNTAVENAQISAQFIHDYFMDTRSIIDKALIPSTTDTLECQSLIPFRNRRYEVFAGQRIDGSKKSLTIIQYLGVSDMPPLRTTYFYDGYPRPMDGTLDSGLDSHFSLEMEKSKNNADYEKALSEIHAFLKKQKKPQMAKSD